MNVCEIVLFQYAFTIFPYSSFYQLNSFNKTQFLLRKAKSLAPHTPPVAPVAPLPHIAIFLTWNFRISPHRSLIATMDESILYVPEGPDGSALAASLHLTRQNAAFRYADSKFLLAVCSGQNAGDRLFLAGSKPLITVYSWGKESPDQRIPVPEPLTCMALCKHPSNEAITHKVPNFQLPWLLAGGSASGKLYIWELSSGNLVCVKEAHYQAINVLKFSECGTFLVSGGADARCSVWKTLDLVTIDDPESQKAASALTFMDHTLAVTDIWLTTGIRSDVRLFSASKDGTIRNYDLTSGKLITTFVLPLSVECLAVDPAGRACYAGLSDGTIRTVLQYKVNPHTSVLEAVGGNGKIVTLATDPELRELFVHHQPHLVSSIKVSLDGTTLVSSDDSGRVMVADAVTTQVVKALSPATSGIIYLAVDTVLAGSQSGRFEKKHRLIPQLKRVLADGDVAKHFVTMELSEEIEKQPEFEAWLQQKAQEAGEMEEPEPKQKEKEPDSEEKLAKLTKAYGDLRQKHEQLLREMSA